MVERSTVRIRRLSDDRIEEARFGRWLNNAKVRLVEMERTIGEQMRARVAGLHVLAIQDTSELNYQAHAGRTRGLGTVGNGRDAGLFVHPVLAVEADSGACLGLVGAQVYARHETAAKHRRALPIESKESMRWLEGAQTAKRYLDTARHVTVVADRESDIYEEWERLPEAGFDLLTRACRDRALADGGYLYAWSDKLPVAERFTLDLAERPGKRSARTATLELRYGAVAVKRPRNGTHPGAAPAITLRMVDVREVDAPAGEDPVHWRLLTTHQVEDTAKALEIVLWYRRRWTIEQLFRTLKTQGLDIESSQLESADALQRLAFVALVAATHILQLLGVRDGVLVRPIGDTFSAEQVSVLIALQPSLEGRTAASKNPHPPDTLAWAAWFIARLGAGTVIPNQSRLDPSPLPEAMLASQQSARA